MQIDDNLAIQFCIMLQAGMPAEDAIRYFTDSDDPLEIAQMLKKWQGSAAVRRAQLKLMGKSWQDMTVDERARYALDQHYSQMAYLLYSTNYISLGPSDKAKADEARKALEAKIAGTAGKGDPMSRWLDDLYAGRLNIKAPASFPPAPKKLD